MSAVVIGEGLVHYEAMGRGKPVVFIHGWLGSWRYWVPAMEEISSRHRSYALDLWGFGDSEMDRYVRYCDRVEECRNLKQLTAVIDRIVL